MRWLIIEEGRRRSNDGVGSRDASSSATGSLFGSECSLLRTCVCLSPFRPFDLEIFAAELNRMLRVQHSRPRYVKNGDEFFCLRLRKLIAVGAAIIRSIPVVEVFKEPSLECEKSILIRKLE